VSNEKLANVISVFMIFAIFGGNAEALDLGKAPTTGISVTELGETRLTEAVLINNLSPNIHPFRFFTPIVDILATKRWSADSGDCGQ
jgi:hypothetical protein